MVDLADEIESSGLNWEKFDWEVLVENAADLLADWILQNGWPAPDINESAQEMIVLLRGQRIPQDRVQALRQIVAMASWEAKR